MLSKKFQGCMVGALLGNGLGAPCKCIPTENTTSQLVQLHFNKLEGASYKSRYFI